MIDQDRIDPENFLQAEVPAVGRDSMVAVNDLEAIIDSVVAAGKTHPSDEILCGTCQLALVFGERVVVFLDGDLADGGGVTDLRAREAHHYECFFPEEEA